MDAGEGRTEAADSTLIKSRLLGTVAGVVHGFTRAVDDRGQRLDLGSQTTPARWAWLARTVGLAGAGVARLVQVHGKGVCLVDAPGNAGDGDALVTRRPGLLLAVRTADCVPVLVAGPGVVAAIHAGWRGLAAGIIPASLARMGAGPWVAAVGPCIGVDRYEVSEEVVAALRATGVADEDFVLRPTGGPRPHADLRRVAEAQLRGAGVEQVEVLPHCTYDTPGLWSHRRDGLQRGSLAAVIGLAGN